jgi:hypothetical protein
MGGRVKEGRGWDLWKRRSPIALMQFEQTVGKSHAYTCMMRPKNIATTEVSMLPLSGTTLHAC